MQQFLVCSSGILTFGAKKTAEESLNGYQADVNKLLNLIEDSCHLIQKENMVHAARKESEKARAKVWIDRETFEDISKHQRSGARTFEML